MPEVNRFLFAHLERMGCLAPLPLMCFCVGAAPLPQNNRETLKVQAAHVEIADDVRKATFTGDVTVEKTDIKITAGAATVEYSGRVLAKGLSPEIKRVVASGNVSLRRASDKARGNWAIYDLKKRYVILIGDVLLERPTGLARGGRLTINLDTGIAVLNDSPVDAPADSLIRDETSTTATRVTGTFSVPSREAGTPR